MVPSIRELRRARKWPSGPIRPAGRGASGPRVTGATLPASAGVYSWRARTQLRAGVTPRRCVSNPGWARGGPARFPEWLAQLKTGRSTFGGDAANRNLSFSPPRPALDGFRFALPILRFTVSVCGFGMTGARCFSHPTTPALPQEGVGSLAGGVRARGGAVAGRRATRSYHAKCRPHSRLRPWKRVSSSLMPASSGLVEWWSPMET